MMKPAHVTILLDETGSMSGQEERVVKGINEYVAELRDDLHKRACRLTIRLFDSARWREFFSGKLKDFKQMKLEDYRPGAMTPLYDAIGKTIAEMEGPAKDHKTLMIIDTDGLENASREHTKTSISKLIKDKEASGWTFVFLGADLEAFGGAHVAQATMGLNISNTGGYSAENRTQAYVSAGMATADWAVDESTDHSADKRFMSRTDTRAFSEVGGKSTATPQHGNGIKLAGELGVTPETVSRWGENPPTQVQAYQKAKAQAEAASNKLRDTLDKLESFSKD